MSPISARSRRPATFAVQQRLLPGSAEVVLGNQVYIDRTKLPPVLVNRIARLAAFQNPEFYAAQAMRLPTFGKPRIISCAELLSKHIALPRGCLDDFVEPSTRHRYRRRAAGRTPAGTADRDTVSR
jgi:hypothetical protein